MSQQNPQPNNWSWMQVAAEATQIGFSIAIPLIIPIGLGLLLDGQLGTRPMFMLIGTLIGMLVSGYTFTRTMSGLLRLSNKNKRTYSKPQQPTDIFTDQPDVERQSFDLPETNPNESPVDVRLRTYKPGEVPLPDEPDNTGDPFQLPQRKSDSQANRQAKNDF